MSDTVSSAQNTEQQIFRFADTFMVASGDTPKRNTENISDIKKYLSAGSPAIRISLSSLPVLLFLSAFFRNICIRVTSFYTAVLKLYHLYVSRLPGLAGSGLFETPPSGAASGTVTLS